MGDQIDDFVDFSSILYRRPFDKGYMINPSLEEEIWERIFGKHVLDIQCAESTLLLSEAPLNFQQMQRASDEMVFEQFGFAAHCRASSPFLASWANFESFQNSSGAPIFSPSGPADPEVCDAAAAPAALKAFDPAISLLVDSGFSFTHAVPIYSHYPINYAIRRTNIGGKLMSNFLKETVSYRHYNMMDEFFLVNQIKEKLCYVSMDFSRDLQLCQSRRNPIRREYILPNGSNILHGHVKGEEDAVASSAATTSIASAASAASETSSSSSAPVSQPESSEHQKKRKAPSDIKGEQNEQSLMMNNERISIPELLFHPNDVGIHNRGLPELVKEAIDAAPADLHPFLYSNVFVAGGNAQLPNFCARLYAICK